MANLKITELNNNANLADSDLIVIVDDVAGTPVTEKRTLSQLLSYIALSGLSLSVTTTDVTDITPALDSYNQFNIIIT